MQDISNALAIFCLTLMVSLSWVPRVTPIQGVSVTLGTGALMFFFFYNEVNAPVSREVATALYIASNVLLAASLIVGAILLIRDVRAGRWSDDPARGGGVGNQSDR